MSTTRTIDLDPGVIELSVVDDEHGRAMRYLHDPCGPEGTIPLGLVAQIRRNPEAFLRAIDALLAEEGW